MSVSVHNSNKTNDDLNSSLFKFKKIELELDDDYPSKRSGHRAVFNEYDHSLYLWGGYCQFNNNRHQIYPELWQFNVATNQWYEIKTSGDIPANTVASHSMIIHGNTLIVYGGTGHPFGAHRSNSIYLCNLKTFVWKRLDTHGQPPLPVYGSSLIINNGYLYILFGTSGNHYYSNVYKIDLKTLESKELFNSIELLANANFTQREELSEQYPNSFLGGRFRQECILYNDEIYTFGGSGSSPDPYRLDIIPVFSTKTNKWRFLKTLPDENYNQRYPCERKCHSCFVIDSYVYTFGGCYFDIDEGTFVLAEKSVWRLDLNTLKWEKLKTTMPVVTYFHASAMSESGQVWFHGGCTYDEDQLIRIPDLYTIKLRVQKLSDICWEKLLNSYPSIKETDRNILLKIGLPINFINRIN